MLDHRARVAVKRRDRPVVDHQHASHALAREPRAAATRPIALSAARAEQAAPCRHQRPGGQRYERPRDGVDRAGGPGGEAVAPGRGRTRQLSLHLFDQPPVRVLARAPPHRGMRCRPSRSRDPACSCHYVQHGVEVRQVASQGGVVSVRPQDAAVVALHEDLRGSGGARLQVPWGDRIELELTVPARKAGGLQLGEAGRRLLLQPALDAGPHRAVAVEDAGAALDPDRVPAGGEEAVPVVPVEGVLGPGRDVHA